MPRVERSCRESDVVIQPMREVSVGVCRESRDPAGVNAGLGACLDPIMPMRGRRPHALLPYMVLANCQGDWWQLLCRPRARVGVATTDVQQVVLEVVQQVNHGASDGHVE